MIWDDDANLPTRDADLGIAQERAMRDAASGYGGIRTVEWQEPDGSWSRLRTRGGNPVFERDGDGAAGGVPAQAQRGFVAQVPGGRAVLFNPYTLAILQSPYTPAAKPYFVESFATTWNVPAGDTTHWYDVVLFNGTTIKVNAKAMPVLQIAADHGFPAIPYLISRHDTSDQYGNAERNATEKRVFAVGRYSVKSWGGGGVVETLTPTTPRTAGKAMTIGQRVDPATNKAYLGQLFFTADAWDDSGAEWGFSSAEITMMLAAPYLTKVSSGMSVAMAPPSLADQGTSTGTMSTPTTLPATAFGLVATGYLSSYIPYTTSVNGYYLVKFAYSSFLTATMEGSIEATYSRHVYSGSNTSTEVQAGVTLTYSGTNVVQIDVRNEYTKYNDTTFTYPAGPRASLIEENLYNTVGGLEWSSGYTPSNLPVYRGMETKFSASNGIYNTSTADHEYTYQNGSFSVSVGTTKLIEVIFYRAKQRGHVANIIPNLTYYDERIGTDSFNTYGMGASGKVWLSPYQVNFYHNPGLYPSNQPPDAVAEINTMVADMASAYQGQSYFDDETNSGFGRPNNSRLLAYYWGEMVEANADDRTLIWASKDYLLHDTNNGVFISIEGSFVGANTDATLTILLRVKTRHHEVLTTLSVFAYMGQVLPETQELVEGSGTWVVPSPQIRAIFAPLYQEQGTFKGAHYVTLAEESNGATPFHGFNFLLRLQMYGDLATCNEDNDGRDVFFVPCNLLEMLYCFVFSQEYGVAESGERYQVTFTARFNAMRDSLFTTTFRVAIRNGVDGSWSDSFGADFASIPNVSLWRT